MEDKKCAVCGDEGLKLCTGCYEIRYCSKEHQKLDWKEHKLQCKTCKEKWDIEVGHHFVASRDLKPGNQTNQHNFLLYYLKIIYFQAQSYSSKIHWYWDL